MRVDDTSHGSEALIGAIRAALARRRDSGNPNGPVPEEARQGVLTLLRGGMSVQRIAEQTELSETTIFRWRAFSPAVKPPTVFSVAGSARPVAAKSIQSCAAAATGRAILWETSTAAAAAATTSSASCGSSAIIPLVAAASAAVSGITASTAAASRPRDGPSAPSRATAIATAGAASSSNIRSRCPCATRLRNDGAIK